MILNRVCDRLAAAAPQIALLTIHDSLLVPPKHAKTVAAVIQKAAAKLGISRLKGRPAWEIIRIDNRKRANQATIMPDQTKPNPVPVAAKRGLFRFSLRGLLVLVLVLAVPLAWIAMERRQSAYEEEVAAKLRSNGFYVITGGPYDLLSLVQGNQPQGRWRNLAESILGQRIVQVFPEDKAELGNLSLFRHLSNLQQLEIRYTSIEDFRPLSRLTGLQSLDLTHTSIEDLAPLSSLTNLTDLNLSGTQISNISPLSGLTDIQSLNLSDTRVRDLSALVRLPRLETLDIQLTAVNDFAPLAELKELKMLLLDSRVGDEQATMLRKALPNCKIYD